MPITKKTTCGRFLNLGIQAAIRGWIIIASAYVYPIYPDWLESLLRPFETEIVALTYEKQRGPEAAKFSEQTRERIRYNRLL